MDHRYDILVGGVPTYKALSQDEFFDKMEDLSRSYYENGFPAPSEVSHTTYTQE